MSNLRILFAAISVIVLFLHGLEAFSRQIQAVGGETLRKWLGHRTESRWRAVVLGVVATAIIQSSSAVTSLTGALVAGIKMQRIARRVAVANLCFNTFGVVLFLPFLGWSAAKMVDFAGEPGMAVAWARN